MSKYNIEIFKGFWTVEDVRNKPNYLFLFGDNDIQKGTGGQAIIRYEPNAFGIPTKKLPNFHPKSFYYDSEYENNISKINSAINKLIKYLERNKEIIGIYFPENGFGTGLANLQKNAQNTLKYLNDKMEEFKTYLSNIK
jgi:hypothetical protein